MNQLNIILESLRQTIEYLEGKRGLDDPLVITLKEERKRLLKRYNL